MTANPFLGVVYHWTGGLAAASFYIPYRAVKRWSWETYWLVGDTPTSQALDRSDLAEGLPSRRAFRARPRPATIVE